jgi:predicted dehydrogenase
MSVARTRIALVGCGKWGRHVLRDLLALGCEVTAVVRSDASRARAEEGGAHRLVESIEALGPVDGAVVVTPTTTHAPVVVRLLDRKIPIYCEKPLTASLADAERLVTAGGERIFVMDKWRYHPGVEKLAEIASSGMLGPVAGVQSTRVGWGKGESDVDAVWHLAPHDLAIALQILGSLPEPVAAAASTMAGEVVSMSAILGRDPWVSFLVSERRRRHFREIRLVCRDGEAVLADSYGEHIVVNRYDSPRLAEPPATELIPISAEMPLLRELRAFVEHAQGGPPPMSSARDALAIVRALDQLRSLAGLDEERPA